MLLSFGDENVALVVLRETRMREASGGGVSARGDKTTTRLPYLLVGCQGMCLVSYTASRSVLCRV